MVQHRTPCFVIADGGQARFVWPAADNALHTREAVESADIHKQTSDLVSDRSGRSFESASPTRHGVEPRSDPHERSKLTFARVIGEKIRAESAAGAFNELVLVAPSHVLEELRDSLDTTTAAKLTGTLAKDLVKVPDHELWPHLKQWVRPTHRQ
jgi:protein required for attachment to host cells